MARFEREARAALRRARAATDRVRGPGRGPLVSVVVAIRGAGEFLGPCLDSVLASTHRAVEVLLVADPGVPAAAAAVAARPRARRVRVVRPRSADSWLADAVAAARGRYLCFADADDVVPPDAYPRLVGLLEETGSDLAVGAQRRAVPGRAGAPPWDAELFEQRRPRQTPASCPEALVDLAPTNKMFRLEAWRAAGLALRSWEAAPATVAAAYLAARGFDVTPGTVYEQHARDVSRPVDEQARFSPAVAAARLAALLEVLARVTGRGAALRDRWLAGALTHLLPPMYVDAVGGGAGYHDVLAPAVRALLDAAGDDLPAQVPVRPRLAGWVAGHGGPADLALLLDHHEDNPDGLPTEPDPAGGRRVLLPDGLSVAPPARLARVEAVDRRLRARAGGLVRDGDRLRVDGAAFTEYDDRADLPTLVLGRGPGEPPVSLHVERRADDRLDLWARRAWEDRTGAGFTGRLAAGDLPGPADGRFLLEVTLGGRSETLVVDGPDRAAGPDDAGPADAVAIDEVRLDGDLLCLSGPAAAPVRTARLTGGRGSTAEVPVRHEDGRLSAQVPLRTTLFGEQVHLPAGRFAVELRHADDRRLPARWAPALLADPVDLLGSRAGVALRTDPDGAAVEVAAPLSAHDRSAFGQQRLRSLVYAAPVGPSYDRTVLLETFRGRSVGDSPGAIGRELADRDLGLDLAWVVDDPSVTPPPGTRAVVRRSREWHQVLGGARAYVGNAGAPYWFEKKPGQVHLQTWHGTPLKRIGEDRGPGDFATWRHRRRIAAQAAGWDALVSPSPFCSPIFRSAFRYDGPLLEIGYPRNDVLVGPRAAEVRERTRAALGLEDGDRAVLYAPTWREYVGVKDPKPLYLDAEELTGRVGDAVVLVRGHYNATGQRDVFADADRIHDVTRYPDIADLYLAADALVTDYSSVMFDFALTDKPVVLLTPDLDQYRDVERGFYFDVERRSPGPLVTTTAEVAEALTGPDRWAAARAEFRSEFCPWDDGRASARAADWLLERL